MSSRPANAVIAPVGSLSPASATERPYLSDEPLIPRIAAAAAKAAAVKPTSSTTKRSHGLAVLRIASSMSTAVSDCVVLNGADCWVGQTTTARPASSGAKQRGIRYG